MRKSLLIALILGFSALSAQNFRADSIRVNTVMPDSCTTINVTVYSYLGCINFTQGPSSFSRNGNVIDFTLNYTSSPICLGAISYPVFNFNMDSIPSGNYTLTATAYLDGIQTNMITSPTILGVASCGVTSIEKNTLKGLKVYPNPAQENLYIEGLSDGNYRSIMLFDIGGKEINLPLNYQYGRVSLNLESIDSGIYFLSIQNGDERIMKKIVVN